MKSKNTYTHFSLMFNIKDLDDYTLLTYCNCLSEQIKLLNYSLMYKDMTRKKITCIFKLTLAKNEINNICYEIFGNNTF